MRRLIIAAAALAALVSTGSLVGTTAQADGFTPAPQLGDLLFHARHRAFSIRRRAKP